MTIIQTAKCEQPGAHGFQASGQPVNCDKPAHWASINPREHDEAEATLYGELAKAQRDLAAAWERAHREAGDKKLDRWTKRERWSMTNSQALAKLNHLAAQADPEHALHDESPINVIRRIQRLTSAIETLRAGIAGAEAVYRAHGWTRFFPCTNPGGHIHRTFRDCSTVHWNTPMAWRPDLSGLTVDEAVATLGPALCSVCFADAPVEHKSMTLGQAEKARTRTERDAAKAARDAAKAAKTLTEGEQFRDGRLGHSGQGDWVTTVHGAKTVLREVMEFKHYSGRNQHHSWYKPTIAAAEIAKAVLLAREARAPGTGATQAEIDQILARAERKQLSNFK